MTPPSREDAFIVFAQRTDARVDILAWNAHATRFFSTRIGLTTDKRYAAGEVAPPTDDAAFVVAPDGEPPGVRSTFARPCDPDDHALAEAAEARGGHTGLSLLARRCGMVWLVVREHATMDVVRGHANLDDLREEKSDRLALRLAAILASVLLGPILDAAAGELFGVKTARAKLEAMVRP